MRRGVWKGLSRIRSQRSIMDVYHTSSLAAESRLPAVVAVRKAIRMITLIILIARCSQVTFPLNGPRRGSIARATSGD